MKKIYLLTFVMTLSMFNLFGQNKNEATKNLYKFEDPENTACIVCNHVLSKERPILYVAHDEEADWQFLCGQDDHTEENAKIISLKQVTELDQTVNDLYEMPIKVGAERKTVKDKWQPFKL
jgi:hypothetical protein